MSYRDNIDQEAFAYLVHKTDKVGYMPIDALNRDLNKDLFMFLGINHMSSLKINVGFLQLPGVTDKAIEQFLESISRALQRAFNDGQTSVREPLLEAMGFDVLNKRVFESVEDPGDLNLVILKRD